MGLFVAKIEPNIPMRVCLGDLEAWLGSKPAGFHHNQQLVAVRNGPVETTPERGMLARVLILPSCPSMRDLVGYNTADCIGHVSIFG